MLIYEKNNKLNINFDNEISENPDIQIGKDGDKTEVLVDGSSNPTIPVPVLPEDVGKAIVVNEDGSYTLANASGDSGPFIITITGDTPAIVDKSMSEIKTAIDAGKTIVVHDEPDNFVMSYYSINPFNGNINTLDFRTTYITNNSVFTIGFIYETPLGSSQGIWRRVYEEAIIPSGT